MSEGLSLRHGRGASARGTVPRISVTWGTVALAAGITAVIGVRLLATLSLVVATICFALLVDWTPAVFAFAFVWGLYALSGAYPFMLGVAFAFLALLALRRWWW